MINAVGGGRCGGNCCQKHCKLQLRRVPVRNVRGHRAIAVTMGTATAKALTMAMEVPMAMEATMLVAGTRRHPAALTREMHHSRRARRRVGVLVRSAECRCTSCLSLPADRCSDGAPWHGKMATVLMGH